MMQQNSTTGEGQQYFGWQGLQVDPEKIPVGLRLIDQWVLWKAEPKPKGDGMNKIPYQVNGVKAASTNPATWTDFDTALGAFNESNEFSGIGFVVTAQDDFIGGDLDHCRDPDTGKLTDLAQKIVDATGTYWEISPSGTGIRFIGLGGSGVRSFKGKGIEVYTSGRYLTITGHTINPSEPQAIKPQFISRLHELSGSSVKPTGSGEPSDLDDHMVKVFKAHGLYQRPLDNGRHQVTCPKWHEHTGDDISGSVYMEGNYNGHAEARFVCQHTHGDKFMLREVMRHLGVVDATQEPPPEPIPDAEPMAWLDAFAISEEVMEKISHPEWIYENLVIQGHVIAIVAAPNGGKTTIMLKVAADMAASGFQVVYINADTSGGDAKAMKEYADQHGYDMILPDLVAGKSMSDVVENLKKMAASGGEFSKLVFIFDTLKKMTNVINKNEAKELYKMFRSLSGQGMTSILLGHTNKYKDETGKPVYEGTGDLRADVDELIYLTGDKRADGTMLVSTIPDKMRGSFKPITFEIDAERNVSRCGYVDVGEDVRRKKRYSDDYRAIEIILDVLGNRTMLQKDVLGEAMGQGVGHNRLWRVLNEYAKPEAYRQCWVKETGFSSNAHKYRRVKPALVSEDRTSVL